MLLHSVLLGQWKSGRCQFVLSLVWAYDRLHTRCAHKPLHHQWGSFRLRYYVSCKTRINASSKYCCGASIKMCFTYFRVYHLTICTILFYMYLSYFQKSRISICLFSRTSVHSLLYLYYLLDLRSKCIKMQSHLQPCSAAQIILIWNISWKISYNNSRQSEVILEEVTIEE